MIKKTLCGLAFMLLLSQAAFSQKGNNDLILGLEVGFPMGDFDAYKAGVGVVAKGLLGIGTQSQIGITTGYTAFKLDGSTDAYKVKTSVIPLLLAYRHNLSLLYLEPQAGYGFFTTTTKVETGNTSTKSTTSNGGFTWAIGAGVQVSALDLGVRYQAGYPDGGNISYLGIHAAYVFRRQR